MRSVATASPLPLVPFTPLCFLALTSCAQGMTSRSAVDVLSSVVLAGSPSVSRGRPGEVPSAPRVIATAEDYIGVPYKGLNVLESDDLRNGIKSYSNWPTIPQLYVKGEFVGGCDIVREMFQNNELQSLFTDKGVAVKQSA